MFLLKILTYIIAYILKQKLLKKKISIQTIIYVLLILFGLRPVLEKALTRVELITELNVYIEYLVMLVLFI